MAQASIKITLPCDIQKVWNTVTDVKNTAWRSDISKTDIINEKQFTEYSNDGFVTNFKITAEIQYQRWEFDIDNMNMKGHWSGTFRAQGNQTIFEFTETITVKKFYLNLFIHRFLHKQQLQYVTDLKRALNCQ